MLHKSDDGVRILLRRRLHIPQIMPLGSESPLRPADRRSAAAMTQARRNAPKRPHPYHCSCKSSSNVSTFIEVSGRAPERSKRGGATIDRAAAGAPPSRRHVVGDSVCGRRARSVVCVSLASQHADGAVERYSASAELDGGSPAVGIRTCSFCGARSDRLRRDCFIADRRSAARANGVYFGVGPSVTCTSPSGRIHVAKAFSTCAAVSSM